MQAISGMRAEQGSTAHVSVSDLMSAQSGPVLSWIAHRVRPIFRNPGPHVPRREIEPLPLPGPFNVM